MIVGNLLLNEAEYHLKNYGEIQDLHNWQLTSLLTYRKFFQIWSTVAGYDAWDFSQSKTEKYFE